MKLPNAGNTASEMYTFILSLNSILGKNLKKVQMDLTLTPLTTTTTTTTTTS